MAVRGPAGRRPSRRTWAGLPRSLVAAGLCLLLVTGLAGAGYLVVRNRPSWVPLHADTVALGSGRGGGRGDRRPAGAGHPGAGLGPPTPSGWWPRNRPGWRPDPCRWSPGWRRDLVIAGAARPARAQPDLRRTGGGLEPGLAQRLAAGLGPGGRGAGPDRPRSRRRADRGLPGPGAAGVGPASPRATPPTGGACPTTAGSSWTGWAGRCGRLAEVAAGAAGARTARRSSGGTSSCSTGPPPRPWRRSTTRVRCRRSRPTTGRCRNAGRPCHRRTAGGRAGVGG